MFFRRLGGHPAAGLSIVAAFFRAAGGNGACEFSLHHRGYGSDLPDGAQESPRTKKTADAQRPYLCAVAIRLDQPERPKPSAPVLQTAGSIWKASSQKLPATFQRGV